MTIDQGLSLAAFIHLAQMKGYELIATTRTNAFFIDKQYFPLFHIQDNSIWNMYKNVADCTFVIQLYDGTILLGGNSKLLWQSVKLDLALIEADIQKLLKEKWIPEAQARSQTHD